MKQPWKTFLIIITYTAGIMIGLYTTISAFTGTTTLNTKKIDSNIEKLKQFTWFMKVYEDEKYHRLFFVNRKVRMYLQSSIIVKTMFTNKYAQKKFISMLDKEVQHRNNSGKKPFL